MKKVLVVYLFALGLALTSCGDGDKTPAGNQTGWTNDAVEQETQACMDRNGTEVEARMAAVKNFCNCTTRLAAQTCAYKAFQVRDERCDLVSVQAQCLDTPIEAL